jgi:hypothetical protein
MASFQDLDLKDQAELSFSLAALFVSVLFPLFLHWLTGRRVARDIRRQDWLPFVRDLKDFTHNTLVMAQNEKFPRKIYDDLTLLQAEAGRHDMGVISFMLSDLRDSMKDVSRYLTDDHYDIENNSIDKAYFERRFNDLYDSIEELEDQVDYLQGLVSPNFKEKKYWFLDRRLPFIHFTFRKPKRK